MPRILYTFATTDRPDVYINSLAYTIKHHSIDKFQIIVISEHGYSNEEDSDKASKIFSSICNQLECLVDSKYYNHQSKSTIEIDCDTHIYEECLDVINEGGTTFIVIPGSKLEKKLKEYIKLGDAFFDVSALKKNLLIDVVSYFLSIGYRDVYSFELFKKATFDQGDLYHELGPKDYKYRNLTNSDIVKNSMKRVTRWQARIKIVAILFFLTFIVLTLLPYLFGSTEVMSNLNILGFSITIASFLYIFVSDK